MAEVGFRAPLVVPLGMYQGEVFVPPAPQYPGFPSMFAFWAGGAQFGGAGEEPPVVTPTRAFYMPTHRARRR